MLDSVKRVRISGAEKEAEPDIHFLGFRKLVLFIECTYLYSILNSYPMDVSVDTWLLHKVEVRIMSSGRQQIWPPRTGKYRVETDIVIFTLVQRLTYVNELTVTHAIPRDAQWKLKLPCFIELLFRMLIIWCTVIRWYGQGVTRLDIIETNMKEFLDPAGSGNSKVPEDDPPTYVGGSSSGAPHFWKW